MLSQTKVLVHSKLGKVRVKARIFSVNLKRESSSGLLGRKDTEMTGILTEGRKGEGGMAVVRISVQGKFYPKLVC
jgi:hypothetical protein